MIRRGLATGATLAILLAPMAGRAEAQVAPAAPQTAQSHRSEAAEDKARNEKADREDGQGGCVYLNQLQGDHALGDRAVIFRANVSDFYRLDFAQRCFALTYPEPKLILTPVGGIGLVCHALDLDVRVGDQGPGSIPEACIPSALHKMTPAEVAAVPKKDLP